MNVQLNSVSDTRKSLVVTLDAGEVDTEYKGVLGEFVKMARLPGFRPGKAPPAMIAKRYAKEIDGEFKQKVVTRAYRDALEKEKLEVLNIVNVEEGTVAAGSPATITVTLDVRPDFKLPDYAGLQVETDLTGATEDEVDKIIEQMRLRARRLQARFSVPPRKATT